MADAGTGAAGQPQTTGDVSASNPSDSVQLSAANQNVSGWFYLDAQGQHAGPFTTEQLSGESIQLHRSCV